MPDFLLGIWSFGMWETKYDAKPTLSKTLSTQSLMSFPPFNISNACHNSLLEELSVSCVTLLGELSEELEPGFFQTSPHQLLPSLIFLGTLLL